MDFSPCSEAAFGEDFLSQLLGLVCVDEDGEVEWSPGSEFAIREICMERIRVDRLSFVTKESRDRAEGEAAAAPLRKRPRAEQDQDGNGDATRESVAISDYEPVVCVVEPIVALEMPAMGVAEFALAEGVIGPVASARADAEHPPNYKQLPHHIILLILELVSMRPLDHSGGWTPWIFGQFVRDMPPILLFRSLAFDWSDAPAKESFSDTCDKWKLVASQVRNITLHHRDALYFVVAALGAAARAGGMPQLKSIDIDTWSMETIARNFSDTKLSSVIRRVDIREDHLLPLHAQVLAGTRQLMRSGEPLTLQEIDVLSGLPRLKRVFVFIDDEKVLDNLLSRVRRVESAVFVATRRFMRRSRAEALVWPASLALRPLSSLSFHFADEPALLTSLPSPPNISYLSVTGAVVTKSALASVTALRGLRSLYLSELEEDCELGPLLALCNLKTLILEFTCGYMPRNKAVIEMLVHGDTRITSLNMVFHHHDKQNVFTDEDVVALIGTDACRLMSFQVSIYCHDSEETFPVTITQRALLPLLVNTHVREARLSAPFLFVPSAVVARVLELRLLDDLVVPAIFS